MKMAYKEIAHEPKSSSSNMQKNHLIKQKSAHQNTEQFLGRPPIIFKMIAKGILCLQKTASFIGKPQHVITKGWSCWASKHSQEWVLISKRPAPFSTTSISD